MKQRIIDFFKHRGRRAIVLSIISTLLLSVAIGGTIAYIATRTDTTNNTFIPPVARIQLKDQEAITNVGNIPVYVRALAIVNWISVEDEHTISSDVPKEGVDFDITFITEGWFLAESDGFYYYEKVLLPGESVTILAQATRLETEKAGYDLRLQLLTTSIQADPIDAVHAAWPAVEVVEVEGKGSMLTERISTP